MVLLFVVRFVFAFYTHQPLSHAHTHGKLHCLSSERNLTIPALSAVCRYSYFCSPLDGVGFLGHVSGLSDSVVTEKLHNTSGSTDTVSAMCVVVDRLIHWHLPSYQEGRVETKIAHGVHQVRTEILGEKQTEQTLRSVVLIHSLFHRHTPALVLMGLAHADFAKKLFFCMNVLLFYVRLLCSIHFCFGPVEIDWIIVVV